MSVVKVEWTVVIGNVEDGKVVATEVMELLV